jgi:hypothetical protein
MSNEGNNVMNSLKAYISGEQTTVKVHVDEVNTELVLELANLVRLYKARIVLKRSGTGITILVNHKD